MVRDYADDVDCQSASAPLCQQQVQAMVIFRNCNQHFWSVCRRTNCKLHVQFARKRRKLLLEFVNATVQHMVVKYHARKEVFGLWVAIVERLRDVRTLLEKQIRHLCENAEAVGALESEQANDLWRAELRGCLEPIFRMQGLARTIRADRCDSSQVGPRFLFAIHYVLPGNRKNHPAPAQFAGFVFATLRGMGLFGLFDVAQAETDGQLEVLVQVIVQAGNGRP
ncbi:hypothetical protein [Paraburkholderia sediminicola]|uniref:hypothetical protein n=1 Tax=Paraburkholderia sediminicola TaxID=458836 RepID=UPI0038BA17F5